MITYPQELVEDKTSEIIKGSSIFPKIPIYIELARLIKLIQWIRFLLPKKDREGLAGDLIEMAHTMRSEDISLWWVWTCVIVQLLYSIPILSLGKILGYFIPDKKADK